VDPGGLDVFHDAADDGAGPVADGIHIHFHGRLQELVDQHRVTRGGQDGQAGKILHILGIVDDFHGPPTQDKGGPHDHRIADGVGDRQGVGDGQGRAVGRLHEAQLFQHDLEQFPVFGPVDAFRLGTQNGNPSWCSGVERFSGVWPPNWTITPSGFSFSTICSTSSRVSGSK
jgi:hypothetical protein